MFRVSLQTEVDSEEYLQPMAFPTEAQAMSYAVGIVTSRPPWTTCPSIRVTELTENPLITAPPISFFTAEFS
jgi:hypothetical protein